MMCCFKIAVFTGMTPEYVTPSLDCSSCTFPPCVQPPNLWDTFSFQRGILGLKTLLRQIQKLETQFDLKLPRFFDLKFHLTELFRWCSLQVIKSSHYDN